jgi:hypothetical protein
VGAVKLCGTFFLDRGRLKKPWSGAEGGRAGRRGGSYQLSFAANIEMEPCRVSHERVDLEVRPGDRSAHFQRRAARDSVDLGKRHALFQEHWAEHHQEALVRREETRVNRLKHESTASREVGVDATVVDCGPPCVEGPDVAQIRG